MYEAIDGPCAECKRDEVCCDHRGRALCQSCWHAARYSEEPYAVFRDADGFCWSRSSYLKEEAEERAAKATAERADDLVRYAQYRDEATSEKSRAHWQGNIDHALSIDPSWRTYTAKPCGSWFGDRIAHPGYMASRRAAIVAAHPEYAETERTGEK